MGSPPGNGKQNLRILFWILAALLFSPLLRMFEVCFTALYIGPLRLILWHESIEQVGKLAYVLGCLTALPWTIYFFVWLYRQSKTWMDPL